MKKFISLMCLVLTFATLFCACNGDEPVETQPVTESVTTTTPAEETTKAPASKLKTYVDIDGTLTATATRVPAMDIRAFQGEGGYYKHAQGGCIMGDYLITCMHSPATNNIPEKVCLVKSELKTGKIVAKSDNLVLGHANDATYNPDDNVIVVADMGMNGRHIVHIVNADTLKVERSISLQASGSSPISYIAYDEVNKRYVCLGGTIEELYVYNRDFKLLKQIKCSGLRDSEEYDNSYLGNGAITDGKYVYIPEWHGGAIWPPNAKEEQIKTYLRIIDLTIGKDVDLIELGFQREPEFIVFRNGKFYIGCNNIRWNGMEFYKVEITTTKN